MVEAHRAGFGASGRNGGQVVSGYRKPQSYLEKTVGNNAARVLWDMAEAAKDQVRRYSYEFAPEARYRPGIVEGAYSAAETRELAEEAEHLSRVYGYDQIQPPVRIDIGCLHTVRAATGAPE